MNEDERIAKYAKDFQKLSNEPEIGLSISPLMAWQIISQLQLALRHPENIGIISEEIRHFVNTLADKIPMTDLLRELFEMGWRPEHDHVIEPSQPNPKLEIRETHNAVTIYGVDEYGSEVERPFAEFLRPQDWGDKERWHYEFFRLEWERDGYKYINNCHNQIPPDPSWDYYPLWNILHGVKNKIDLALKVVSENEYATPELDNQIKEYINLVSDRLTEIVEQHFDIQDEEDA